MYRLRVNIRELPQRIELYDDSGRSKLYQLEPAGKKRGLGMFLVGAGEEPGKIRTEKK
jgi:hypothetical protein